MANILAMSLSRGSRLLLACESTSGLPDVAVLIERAACAGAPVIVCLRLSSARVPRTAVASWLVDASRQLLAADAHLLTFDADLALVLGNDFHLTRGLTPIAPHVWLIVRLWTPGSGQQRPLVTFVGPATKGQRRFVGSLWADELLKPEDIDAVRAADTVVTEVDILHSRQGLGRSLNARRAAEFHERLGWAVIERARPRTVWAWATGEHREESTGPVRLVLVAPGEQVVAPLASPLAAGALPDPALLEGASVDPPGTTLATIESELRLHAALTQ